MNTLVEILHSGNEKTAHAPTLHLKNPLVSFVGDLMNGLCTSKDGLAWSILKAARGQPYVQYWITKSKQKNNWKFCQHRTFHFNQDSGVKQTKSKQLVDP